MRSSYLVELAVAAVEDELKSYVGAILNTADAGGREVDVHTEYALASRLEERQELLEVPIAVLELREACRVLHCSEDTSD